MTCTYFTTLPCELHGNIIRFLSKKPKSSQWEQSINAHNIKTICELKNELALELSNHLKCISKTRSSFIGNLNNCMFTFILEQFESTVSELRIYSQTAYMRNSLSWVAILERCTSLTSLSISIRIEQEFFNRILCKRGKKLKSLSVRLFGTPGFVSIMSMYCNSLERLELLNPHENCTPLWKALNNSLTELHVQIWRSDPNTGNIQEIQNYCRSLVSINVSLPWFCSVYEPIAELYASYGNQLRNANLSAMNETLCAFVASKCRNARFTISSLNSVIRRMYVLGRNLAAVEFSCTSDTDIEELKIISERCPNIENLKYIETISSTTGYLNAVLCEPKPFLKSLDLRHSKGLDEQTIIDLSCRTGNLEHFFCSVHFCSKLSFAEFAKSNEKLQTIELYLKPPRSSSERFTNAATPLIHDIFKSFRNNLYLEEIKIQCSFPFKLERFFGRFENLVFKELAKPFISLGVYVEIFDVHYN